MKIDDTDGTIAAPHEGPAEHLLISWLAPPREIQERLRTIAVALFDLGDGDVGPLLTKGTVTVIPPEAFDEADEQAQHLGMLCEALEDESGAYFRVPSAGGEGAFKLYVWTSFVGGTDEERLRAILRARRELEDDAAVVVDDRMVGGDALRRSGFLEIREHYWVLSSQLRANPYAVLIGGPD